MRAQVLGHLALLATRQIGYDKHGRVEKQVVQGRLCDRPRKACEYLSNYRNPPRKAGPLLHYGNPCSDNREDDERK